MLSTVLSAIPLGIRVVATSGVVELQEGGLVPVGNILRDVGLLGLTSVVFDGHEELAVVLFLPASFFLEFISPER